MSLTRGTLRWDSAQVCGLALTKGTATGGSTTTLVDSSTSTDDILQSTLDASERLKGCYAVMTGGTAGNIGHWREIADDAPGTGTLTFARALPSSVASGDTYEVYAAIDPGRWSLADTNSVVDIGLTRCQYLSRSPITLVTDGDMETSGTAHWTPTNATVAKSTTDGVTFGAQSLVVTNTSANGYAQSDSIAVTPNIGFVLWADYRGTSTTLSTAVVQAWDVTNSVQIGANAQDADNGVNFQGGLLQLGFTVPATCYRVAIRLGAKEAAGVVAFDDVVLMCEAQSRYTLPSWLVSREQYATLLYRTGNRPLNYRYIDVGWPLNIEEDPSAVVTFRCDLPPQKLPYPVYLSGERPYGPMGATADSTTTAAPLEWAKYHVAEAAYEVFGRQIEQASYGRQRMDRTDVAARVAELDSIFKPNRNTRLGFSKPFVGASIGVLP